VTDLAPVERLTPSLAVVGLACRYPDADDAPELLDVVLTGRRAFRRIPPVRLDLADYYQPDPATSDATYSTRAALIEGWQFDCAAFGVEPAAYAAADPALWLALETTARALAGAGLTGGTGLDRDRTAVIIGNTLGGDTSRANALRVRWPYVRRVLSDALATELPTVEAGAVLRRAERQYLAPFPIIGPDTLAGSSAGAITAAICSYFGFRGGSHAIDSTSASSTQAVASACAALAVGEIDAAIAGGVDISLDPLELIGLAKAGVLAADQVRIYDQDPTGYLPAEGCGIVVLMRTADARAAGLPVYAEILGWGASATGHPDQDEVRVSCQLLAMQRAYERAGIDPAEIQFFEGNGTGTREDDDAELAALGVLRRGALQPAALGSVKANIGHAKAAAGVASLIKTVLSLSNGVLPPAAGVRRPHPMITDGDARLTLPQVAAEWPDGVRLAGVSTLSSAGANVHLVLRAEPAGKPRADRSWRLRLMPTRSLEPSDAVVPRLMTEATAPVPFLLHAPDRFALAAVLNRLAGLARWLSDAELQDLACSLGRSSATQGRSRVALVAAGQEQLGALAAEAAALLPQLTEGLLTIRPGIFASEEADGRVALLLSGAADAAADDAAADDADASPLTNAVTSCLDTLRWLESLDVDATAAVGDGMGALAGLAWAGVLGQSEVVEIAELRAKFLHRAVAADGAASGSAANGSAPAGSPADGSAANGTAANGTALIGSPASRAAANGSAARGSSARRPARPTGRRVDAIALRATIGQKYRFGPPRRRLISTLTGAEIQSVDAAVDLICSGFAGSEHLADALGAGAVGATLLVETGPGDALARAAADSTPVPAVSLTTGFTDPGDRARVAAALFAAGALGQPKPLFAGQPGRSIDIWRERTFIVGPCETRPQIQLAESTATVIAAPAAVIAAPAASTAVVPATDAPEPAATTPATEPAAAVVLATDRPEPAVATTPEAESAADAPGPELELDRSAKPADVAVTTTPEDAEPDTAEPAPAKADLTTAEPETAEPETAEPAPANADLTTAEPDAAEPDAESSPGEIPLPAAERWPASLSDLRDEFERPLPAPSAMPLPPVEQLAGAGSWARCFTEELHPVTPPADVPASLTWRLHASGDGSRMTAVQGLFTGDPAAPRALAVISDPADDDSRAVALQAARDAIMTGQLVVVTTSQDYTGFFAGLQAEHPSIGVTILRIPDAESLTLTPKFAVAQAGQFRELMLAADGTASEPGIRELALTGGAASPLGPEDVVLVSRGARGAGLALAQVLACCGTPVAVIGRADDDDSELVAGLEQLRSAGARVAYEVIDLANPTSLAAAVQRIEARLGPVTAIGHAVSPCDPVPFLELTDIEISDHAASEAATLGRLVGSVRPGQLRMIITFGSVAGRYGLAGGSVTALSSGALAARATQLATAGHCRSLHVDIPAWSTTGLGDRQELTDQLAAAGTAPLDVSVASRLLLKIMTTGELPDRLALHGRVAGPAAGLSPAAPDLPAAALAAAGLPGGGRFARDVRVYYPGIELICAPALAMDTDPYLADYRLDGLAMLPPAMALEALAQAASVLAGHPVRAASAVRLESPVVVPATGKAQLRICALRDGSTVTAVLRCADSSFTVDHARAEFTCAETAGLPPVATAGVTAQAVLSELTANPSGLVDGAEIYGPIAFQGGRFQRIALLSEVTTRSCRALARGADDQPWFEPGSPYADSQFVLGSPGLADATLQVLQACVPHRRLRTAGCSAVLSSGRQAQGAVEIRARVVQQNTSGGLVPAQAPAPAAEAAAADGATADDTTAVYRNATGADVGGSDPAAAEGEAGQPGPGPRPRSRKARRLERQLHRAQVSRPDRTPAAQSEVIVGVPVQATAPAQERAARPGAARDSAAADGAVPGRAQRQQLADQRWDIEAVDADGELLIAWRGVELRDAGPLARNSAWPPSLLAVYLERSACDIGLDDSLKVVVDCGQPGAGEQPAGPERAGTRAPSYQAVARGAGPLAGFSLTLTAAVPVACAWATAAPGHRHDLPPAAIAPVFAQLRDQLAEPAGILATRLHVIASCLTAAGLPAVNPGEWAAGAAISGNGWVLMRTPTASVACAVVEVSGAPGPMAVAMLTDQVADGSPAAGAVVASAGGLVAAGSGTVPG
jgi:enediyne polyketide synthase